ncbi:MAG TPA: peroxiredoxin [Dermatophilaceae bacterium]|nr:peroxiredoxin [Dermatophilaceae bacterium]
MSHALQVGDLAPDFTLRDQHGVGQSLAELIGSSNVAVVFYPFAFSGICTGELREIRDTLEDFQDDGIQVLAVSCDPMYALRVFADQEGYFFPLCSDFWPHGEVARAYGAFLADKGFATRATFLVDRDRRIRYAAVNPPGEHRDFAPYRAALADLRAEQGDAATPSARA